MHRRVLRRPAHPRPRRRVVRARVPGVRLPVPRPRERLRVLDETLTVVKRLWTEETVTFDGRHLQFDGAYCDPKPLQAPPADLGRRRWRAGHPARSRRARPTRPTGRSASTSSCTSRRCSRAHCERIGRDFDSIVRTHGPDCRLFDSERDLAGVARRRRAAATSGVGVTPRATCATTSSAPRSRSPRRCRASSTRDVAEFVLWFRDFPATESLERFMAEVVPAVVDACLTRRRPRRPCREGAVGR